MGASQNFNISLNINANAQSAEKQLQNLQKQLQQISTMQFDVGIGNLTPEIEKASQAAMKLSAHLATAMNPQTGNLDFTKFYTSIQKSGMSLQEYGRSLQNLGPAGQRAFIGLADSIAKSEIPLKRTSKMVDKMWDGLKRTAGWQLQSSIIHGVIGGVQQAVGYAKDLNKSLTDIRIVTGQSTDQMAKFAKEANKAAKNLSTTTTDYTKASLIYYQQGLSDAEVKARTETTIKMANATGTSAQKVSDQMTAIWNNYDNGTKSLTHYADVMTALGAATASSTDEIAQGLQKFASISNTVGLSYEYAASALATITAESRESADVVGNALKTLFSRIQGLQLGETLDDGTTLNKYSNALSKVGISIKDQSGELKNMDDILNEMGTRWSTLARDEKMALAQTVAGVRQYTQLMTLMENWDDFQKNLTTAKTSTGTLDAQALIYADSWEAASKRMKASWEGLWDNLIDSEGMSDVLDKLSSFADILTTITTGMGGAKGALSSFSALFLKLFTPQIGASINNMAYGIKMMFGGKDTMQQARDQWLTQTKNSLSADSAYFNIGQAEGKAYQDVLQHKISTSLAFSRHWDAMSTEERLYAQQQQANYEQFSQQYLAAGQQYDASKNALSDAYWDLYEHGSVKDKKILHPLEQRAPLVYSEQQQLKANRARLEQGRTEVGQGRNIEHWITKGHMAEAEATVARLEAKSMSYGTRLKSQASAMLDFEKTIGSFGSDSQKNLEAFTQSWAQMDDVLSTTSSEKVPLGAKKFKDTMQSLIEAGDIEGAQSYFRTQSAGLNDIVARTLAEQAGLDPGTFSQYMSGATQAEIDKRTYEAYQAYQKRQEEQQLKDKRTNPANWGQGLVSAAQGAMGAISLKQQADALFSGNLTAGETVSAVTTGAMSAGMALSGFSSALTATGLAVGKAAGIWGAALTAIVLLLSYGLEELEKKFKADKIAAEQAAKAASLTADAHQEAVNYSNSLKTQIASYQEANDAIKNLTYGSQEREEAVYEANKQALSLISQNNLQEGTDYTKTGNQIQIKEDTLTNLQEEADAKIRTTDAAAQLSSLAAQVATAKSNATDIRNQMLKEKGAGDAAEIAGDWISGAGQGAMIAGGSMAALSAAASAGVVTLPFTLPAMAISSIVALAGAAVHGAGELWENHAQKYQAEVAQGFKYISENGTEILNQTAQEIATELGVSEETAKLLKKNKTQLANYAETMSDQGENLKLVTDNIARNIIAENKAISNSDYATEISNAAGRAYQKKYETERNQIVWEMNQGDAQIRDAAQRYADLMGYSDYSQFKLGDIDKDNRTVSYSYWDAESQTTVTKEMAYDQISSSLGSAAAEKYLDGEWADSALKTAKELNAITGGKGLFSIVTGGDFGNTSIKQIQEFQQNVDKMDPARLAAVREQFGYTEEEWNSLINKSKAFDTQVFDKILADNGFGSSKLSEGYEDWMSIGNMQSLAREMLSFGPEVGTEFSNKIFDMLTESGIDTDEWSNAMDLLLNSVDWSDWDAMTQARLVIESLGGHLDTGSAAWRQFANDMREAQGAVPDFSNLVSQLGQIVSLLNQLSAGDTIDDETFNTLIELLGGKEGKFANLFKTNANGEKEFIGTEEDAKEIRGAYINESEAALAAAKQDVAEKNTARDTILDDASGIGNLLQDGDITWHDIVSGAYGASTSSAIETLTGMSRSEITELSTLAGQAKGALTTANTTLNTKQTELTAAQTHLETLQSELQQGKDLDGDGVVATEADINAAKATVQTAQEAVDIAQAGVESAQQTLDLYQNQQNDIASTVDNILDNGVEDMTAEQESQVISAKYDTYSRFSEGVAAKDSLIVDEKGDYTEAGIKQLKSLALTYASGEEAVRQYNEAMEDGTEVEQAEALRQMELAAAISDTANARGIDAEALHAQVQAIEGDLKKAGVDDAGIVEAAADMVEASEALTALTSSADKYKKVAQAVQKANGNLVDPAMLKDLGEMVTLFNKIAGAEDLGIKNTGKLNNVFQKFLKDNPDAMEDFLNGSGDAIKKWQAQIMQMKADELLGTDFIGQAGDALDALGDKMGQYSDQIDGMKIGDTLGENFAGGAEAANQLAMSMGQAVNSMVQSGMDMGAATDLLADATDFQLVPVEGDASSESGVPVSWVEQESSTDENGAVKVWTTDSGETVIQSGAGTSMRLFKVVKSGGSGGSSGGGGGGGGGGGPKKVANKRKSQTVKRYKKNDAKRANAQSAKKSASTQKDYLYGQSKIAQMEKINKLAEKEAHITSDRIKESQKYLKEDRENLIKVMQKWGYDATFDEDGFLTSYEEAWTKIHEKIAKLYEDNELTADEQKLEEDYKVELEELEGALEDYENSLKELQADIEAYEESLYEMYDNKVEQMQHKVEFKIELNEDDLSYLDFWIEALGDSLYNALESLQTMGQKTDILFDGINTYKEGIEDIYALSDDPLHTWATGGLDEVLTQDQVDALRENRDGLMDYMQQLLDLRDTMQDKVLDTFDKWQEKLNATLSTIEHYGSVMEHFKNIIDIVGKDVLGLSDRFMSNLTQSAVDQSMDNIDATKAHYDSLVEQNATAQQALEDARARGDQSSVEHWEKVVQTTTEEMQSAQDALLSSLENTLTMIAEQFEQAMTQAVEAFNDAIYAHGGLAGLQEDYSLIREQADLMAEDYDKIYQLSKLNRNINKTLNDSNIIAGKQKMKSLQQEINELQASGVELSKYDLDYLQAKYELRLAELELENAKNNKDTVRLSKDSEGNWSYVYTTSMDKVDEAQQKYEDALYAMQNLSYEYMEEMSAGMMNTSLAMMEEIQALRIQDFNSYEEYSAEVQRIQDKYRGYLSMQQDELNKSVTNNEDLYNKDWQSYSAMTGYKISANQDWADSYSETTLGMLLGSSSTSADFADNILNLSSILINDLGGSAITYFANVETAMNKYGSSISGFGSTVTTTVNNISTKSKTAAEDMKSMAADMNKSFADITAAVTAWQTEFSKQIDDMLTEIGDLIKNINLAIQQSANLTGDSRGSASLIGTDEAVSEINKIGKWGELSRNEDGSINIKGFNRDIDGDNKVDNDVNGTTIVAINAALIREIDEMMRVYFNTDSKSDLRKTLGEQLKQMFKDYHEFRDIVSRIYDITDLQSPTYAEPASMDTGGYTGEWGSSGKLAMLHEKELVLNANDTTNFLDALNISRDVINRMIEMNAMQSSLGFGNLAPATLRDFAQSLEQQVSITAEFPNAIDHNEIEEAFGNLINQASQYAHRYK